MADTNLDKRLEALGKQIEAARARLAAEQGFKDVEVGDILASINSDFDGVVHENEAAAHEAYDRIEARLAEIQPLLAGLPR